MTTLRTTVTVYRIDPKTGLYLFPEDLYQDETGDYHVPGNCVYVELPESQAGQWPKWTSDVSHTNYQFGHPSTGQWSLIDDYRKTDLYLTTDGSKYTIDADHTIDDAVVTYCGYGLLPDWLTTIERPSQFHDWDDEAWIPDQDAIDAHETAMERGWRDGEIVRVSWLRDRHRDELEQELQTTLTAQQYDELQLYIQALRDWPADPKFPQAGDRPVIPAWLQD